METNKKHKKTSTRAKQAVTTPESVTSDSGEPQYAVIFKTGGLTLEKRFTSSKEADDEVAKINQSSVLNFVKKTVIKGS